ncbi:hypothetical protein Q1695_001086 [Nippostrongylus brasiliensis]|nr:hypothetical protein Q1695_001086 [Nippostrongylus brasiliensis]
MECVFSVSKKEGNTAAVLPQRSFATCSITVSLSRLSLDNEGCQRSQNNGKSSSDVDQLEEDNGCLTPDVETLEDSPLEPAVHNEPEKIVTIYEKADVLEEDSCEEPAAKRIRSQIQEV